MIETIALVSVCVGMLALLTMIKKSKQRPLQQLPPGPSGIPFIGQGFGLNLNSAYLKFTEWNKEHGDIMCFTIFGRKVVSLSHPDVIRRAFSGNDASLQVCDRPKSFIGYYVAGNYQDILFREYDTICEKLKSVTSHALHTCGHGSDVYREHAQMEINHYTQTIADSNGSNVDIIKPLEISLCRLIGMLFTGNPLSDDDPVLKSIINFDHHGNKLIMPQTHLMLKLFPFLRYLPGRHGNIYRHVMREKNNMRRLLITKMKETYSVNKLDCLTHALFDIQKTESWLTDDYILGVLMDLINTSTLTSRGVLSGFFLLLVHYQDVQQRIRQEIGDVIGHETQPSAADLHRMPYTHACMLEVLRYQSHLGLTATHTNAAADVNLDGFVIPKGTSIYGNQWAVHHDERFWENPFEFKPDRFLQADGQILPTDNEVRSRLMPFGVGSRACMGTTITYDRMFLYVTTLLQNYQLLPPSGNALPSADARELTPGTVLQAPNFLCRVVARDDI